MRCVLKWSLEGHSVGWCRQKFKWRKKKSSQFFDANKMKWKEKKRIHSIWQLISYCALYAMRWKLLYKKREATMKMNWIERRRDDARDMKWREEWKIVTGVAACWELGSPLIVTCIYKVKMKCFEWSLEWRSFFLFLRQKLMLLHFKWRPGKIIPGL